eukprot:3416806-Rhodomonas_salina.1
MCSVTAFPPLLLLFSLFLLDHRHPQLGLECVTVDDVHLPLPLPPLHSHLAPSSCSLPPLPGAAATRSKLACA